jgi:serine/threonine protein phosphatase PrpC
MNIFRRLFGRPKSAESDAAAESVVLSDTEPMLAGIPAQTRPLPPPAPYRSTTRRIKFGHASDIGQVRSNNQDALFTFLASMESSHLPPPFGLFLVADGMGGHHDGERASAIAAQTIGTYITDAIYLPLIRGVEPGADQKTIPEVLAEAMEAANQEVALAVPEGGTTVTCAVIRSDLVYIAHVGDSRAYLIADDNIELITRDHSLVQRLQELGQLTPEEAQSDPRRNMLYSAIGQGGGKLQIDFATRRLPPSSSLLLCSDGLWNVVEEERVLRIIRDNPDPQEACDRLIEVANREGGPDNVTVILVQMPD